MCKTSSAGGLGELHAATATMATTKAKTSPRARTAAV
jgi:hypothetical protein